MVPSSVFAVGKNLSTALSTIHCSLFTKENYQLSTINYQPSIINFPLWI